jgi:mono/diheme cytochrome c family protein
MKAPHLLFGKGGSAFKWLAVLGVAVCSWVHAESPFIGGLAREGTEHISGAVLVSELGCVACHKSEQIVLQAKPGPNLSAVGSRVHGEHLKKYLTDPSRVKPGTTMPNVLSHLPEPLRADTAEALAHYLATKGEPVVSDLPKPDAVERGKLLFHSVGCVACHAPEQNVPASVGLGPLTEKYSVKSLAFFLERPLEARPAGRMPDCHLQPKEAADIASYLLRDQTQPLPKFVPDAALAAKGKTIFTEHRCHACHDTGEKLPAITLKAFHELNPNAGCLSEQSGKGPHYALSEQQRTAIRKVLASGLKDWTPEEQIQITLTKLNCISCHQRDSLGGIVKERNEYFTGTEESLGEQGRIPPALTGVGAKLKAPWLREVIAHGAGVRTTMKTRMPKFGEPHAESLVPLLKQIDQLPPLVIEEVPKAQKPHQVGRELVGAKGLNCIACHAFRGRTAAIRGPELTTMGERLEQAWFHHFMAQPQRFAPLTVMPSFWPEGKSPLPEVLGGNASQQQNALWQYLMQGPEASEPSGLVLEPLIVAVKEEAVIIRRAFPGIGKRGIAVGYPREVNLAFDASQMRLAMIWSGAFVEASGIWRGQGSGQLRALGKPNLTFPNGPALARLATADAAWPAVDPTPQVSKNAFQGYSLDEKQRPTFRYLVDGIHVVDYFQERLDAGGKAFLERTLTFPDRTQKQVYLRVASDPVIDSKQAMEYTIGSDLRVRLNATANIREADGAKELILPVKGDSINIEYHFLTKP